MSIRIKQGDKWVEVKVPIYTDTTLTQKGQAADAEKVGELLTSTNERVDQVIDWMQDSDSALENMEQIIDNLPVKVSTDGFTDVLNTRLPLDISIKETTGYLDGSSDVEIAMNLSGDKKLRTLISFDKDNHPTSLSSSGTLCPISWIEAKVPSAGADTEGEDIATYIIQNGAINTTELGSYTTIARGGNNSVTPYIGRPSGADYLEFSGGDQLAAGSMEFGSYNTMAFEFISSFDLTEYHTLKVEVRDMNFVPTYLRVRDVDGVEYSSSLVLESGLTSDYVVEKDISEITGKKIIRIEGRSENVNGDSNVRITNMYLIGKAAVLSPDVLYMTGPSGSDVETFGALSGYRYLVNANSFVLRWPNGQNGDYQFADKNGVILDIGATPNITHANYVDFSEYKTAKVITRLEGSMAKCTMTIQDESGEIRSSKSISIGENNFDISSIVEAYGPMLKIGFNADLKSMSTNLYFTEVSFSK